MLRSRLASGTVDAGARCSGTIPFTVGFGVRSAVPLAGASFAHPIVVQFQRRALNDALDVEFTRMPQVVKRDIVCPIEDCKHTFVGSLLVGAVADLPRTCRLEPAIDNLGNESGEVVQCRLHGKALNGGLVIASHPVPQLPPVGC